MSVAYLGLGSNMGNRGENLRRAIYELGRSGKVRVTKQSSVYETEPVGVKEQPWYFNMALEVETDLLPEELLGLTKQVEAVMGRRPSGPWGPRVIDVDILVYPGVELSTEGLTVPHKELENRAFVLVPLSEIAPDLPLPGGKTAKQALAALAATDKVFLYARDARGPGPRGAEKRRH